MIHVKVTNGRIDVALPPDWKEGTEVSIIPESVPTQKIGMTEDEWRDDEVARAEWVAWSESFEPWDMTESELQELEKFRLRVKEYTIEAVRKQMAEDNFE